MSKKPPAKTKGRDLTWPLGKAREEAFDRDFAKAVEASTADDAKGSIEARRATNERLQAHPDAKWLRELEAALAAFHLRPGFTEEAPELAGLVMALRETLADAWPGMTVRDMLEPLAQDLSRRGGGSTGVDRIKVRDFFGRWVSENGKKGAVSATAAHFGLTTRQVSRIVNSPED